MVNSARNIVGRKIGSEVFLIIYEDAQTCEALRTLGRWASNPELCFGWYEAAVVSQSIRRLAEKAEQETVK